MPEQPTIQQQIYDLVEKIPPGKVMTYGQIAGMVSDPRNFPVLAIQVGHAMAASKHFAPDLPWWRVIGKERHHGVLRKTDSPEQHNLLAHEGVLPDRERFYDLSRYLYEP